MYKAAFLFEHKRQALQKILVTAIDLENEYYANGNSNGTSVVEAVAIDAQGHVRKITDSEELEIKGTMNPEQKRDWSILNRKKSWQNRIQHRKRFLLKIMQIGTRTKRPAQAHQARSITAASHSFSWKSPEAAYLRGDFICALSCDVDETLVGKIAKRSFLALQRDEARWQFRCEGPLVEVIIGLL
jgi:hypothetical protein